MITRRALTNSERSGRLMLLAGCLELLAFVLFLAQEPIAVVPYVGGMVAIFASFNVLARDL